MDATSKHYKSLPPKSKERNNLGAKFGRVKKIVKLMLLNVGTFPVKKPCDDPKQLVAWQENLLKLGKQAEGNIHRRYFGDLPLDKLNISKVVNNVEAVKHMLENLKLPQNTPPLELKFFSS